MAVIAALIQIVGRIILLLLTAQIRMMAALGSILGAAIVAIWRSRQDKQLRQPRRRSRRRRRRYASNRR